MARKCQYMGRRWWNLASSEAAENSRERKRSSRTRKKMGKQAEQTTLVWSFHNDCSSHVIVPAGVIWAPQPATFKGIFTIQTHSLTWLPSSVTWDNRILPKYLELLVETKPKQTYETIFSLTCFQRKTTDCCREVITNVIYQYLFKLVFLAKQMGVNNFMVEKNSTIYYAFLQWHNDKITLNAKKKKKPYNYGLTTVSVTQMKNQWSGPWWRKNGLFWNYRERTSSRLILTTKAFYLLSALGN